MLWDASVMKGYAIEAQDGRLGTVSGFLFEDATISRQQVKAGPAYDPSKMPDRANEYLMIKYYRRGA